MPAKTSRYRDIVESAVFVHYLRTGQRADVEELLALVECKFNPYHDEIGRFTSASGATSSVSNTGHSSAAERQRRAATTSSSRRQGFSSLAQPANSSAASGTRPLTADDRGADSNEVIAVIDDPKLQKLRDDFDAVFAAKPTNNPSREGSSNPHELGSGPNKRIPIVGVM